jgi:hypothetical protein
VKGGLAQADTGLVLMIVTANNSNKQINNFVTFFFNFSSPRALPVFNNITGIRLGRL